MSTDCTVKSYINLPLDLYELDIHNEIMKSFLSHSTMIDIEIFNKVNSIICNNELTQMKGILKLYEILLNNFDGTGRSVREIQKEAFRVIAENIEKNNILFLQMGVGSGKSAVLKSVQNFYKDAAYMTAQNVLLDQLKATYPDLPVLKGKKRYKCYESNEGFNCSQASQLMTPPGHEACYCKMCPYSLARKTALKNESVGVNLMSFFFLQYSRDFVPFKILLIDEAHVILSALRNLASKTFSQSDYDYDEKELTSDRKIVSWMRELIDKLETVKDIYEENNTDNTDEIDEIEEHINQIGMIVDMIEEAPQNYVFSFKQAEKGINKFTVQPIKTPDSLLKKVLSSTKMIFTSGTLLKHHVDELSCGKSDYYYCDLGMPIPKEYRSIKFHSLEVRANYNTDARDYCKKILEVISMSKKDLAKETEGLLDYLEPKIRTINFKRLNIVIHVTYSLQRSLEPILRQEFGSRLYVNNPDNKQEVVSEFIKNGGIFLAAGCAEGLDFDYDKCRIQIIPKLPFPNLNDEVVMKRKGLSDGNQWYILETFTTLIQMIGRSTRAMDDFSITYVLDPMFPRLVNEYRKFLPKSFLEAIKWR